jgi:hypothetical protein
LTYGPAPVEVTTDKAGPYLRVLDELVPNAVPAEVKASPTASLSPVCQTWARTAWAPWPC